MLLFSVCALSVCFFKQNSYLQVYDFIYIDDNKNNISNIYKTIMIAHMNETGMMITYIRSKLTKKTCTTLKMSYPLPGT